MLADGSEKHIIARWAEDILKRHRVNQEQAARISGLQKSTLSRLLNPESYKSTPSSRTLSQFARAFMEPLPPLVENLSEPSLQTLEDDERPAGIELMPGQFVVRVNDDRYLMGGYRPGSYFILDQRGIKAGDGEHVMVSIRNEQTVTSEDLIMVVDGEYLLPLLTAGGRRKLHRGQAGIVIRGVIVKSWWEHD